MKKIWQKSLASMVSAALCLTAFVGCLTVNAATTYQGTIKSDGVEVTETAESANVTLNISSPEAAMNIAAIAATTDFGTLTAVTVKGDNCKIDDIKDLAKGRFYVDAIDNNKGFNTAAVTLTFTKAEKVEVGNHPVTITYFAKESAATFNEDIVNLTVNGDINITVTSATTEPVYDSSVKIVGKNGLFESDYSLLFYVPTTLPDGWYIEATMAKYNKNTRLEDVTKTLTIDDLYDTTTISGNTYYRVALKGIAAKEVANEITVTLHKVVDGVDYYGDSIQYNLVSYATARIAKNQANEVAAMVAFLNYASAAQTRFGYNTTNLANASLTDEQKVVTPVSEITDATRDDNHIVIDNPTATLNGFAPSYEDKMTLVTYCKVPDNYVEAGLKIKYEYTSGSINKVEYISLSESTVFNQVYRQVAFTGLAIKEVRTPVLVTVVDSNNNPISNTRRYSFEVYAASRKTTSDDYAPARAMVTFGDLFKVFKENK